MLGSNCLRRHRKVGEGVAQKMLYRHSAEGLICLFLNKNLEIHGFFAYTLAYLHAQSVKGQAGETKQSIFKKSLPSHRKAFVAQALRNHDVI